jgi:hypothetical protein
VINQLIETSQPAALQDTTFSTDVLGRYVCNTWDEAVNNAGPPFDAAVIGGGRIVTVKDVLVHIEPAPSVPSG